ncbi:MAG: UDP-glucose 4-epimerase GalE [Gorillibacterium sp.]|nr:UDP-glucose 4-epimerase GalE [Gorillibacterium sp.]
MAILVTGGAGYIGSHTCVELLDAGFDVVIVDNLSNSKLEVMKRIREITGKTPVFYNKDLLDSRGLDEVFSNHLIEAVIHFAGYKAVGESVQLPLQYYRNNITGTLILCEAMKKYGVHKLVFSSSATVYGMPEHVPIAEDAPLSATNPYGRTKLMTEEILRDLHLSDNNWSIAVLRYFNPVGAHKSGRMGEDPGGTPNNLMPYITQVAVGKRKELQVFGADYPTPDGTGVRDYIHVTDLAAGHLKALAKIAAERGVKTYNLGTGQGYSVLEMVQAVESVSGQKIPYAIVQRRAGDVAICYADPTKANLELNWRAERGIEEMCEDAWRWQSLNPEGYKEDVAVWKLRNRNLHYPLSAAGGE